MPRRGFVSTMMLALLGAATLSSVFWGLRDQSVWAWDQAWYAEVAHDLAAAWARGSLAWARAMGLAFGIKPPLLGWAGQALLPLADVLDRPEPILLLLPIGAMLIAIIATWAASRLLGASAWAALAGALVLAASPMMVGLSHQFLAEAPQAAASALLVLAVAWAAGRSAAAAWGGFILAGALGLLVKTTLALPIGVFAAWLVWNRRRATPLRSTPAVRVLLVVAVLVAAGTAGWYALNWRLVVGNTLASTVGAAASLYGDAAPLPAKLLAWLQRLMQALSLWTLVPLVISGCLVAGLAIGLARGQGRSATLALTACVGLTLVGMAAQTNDDPRFLAPLVPVLGVLLALALSHLSRMASLAIVVVLVGQGMLVHAMAHGVAAPVAAWRHPWLRAAEPSAGARDLLAQGVGAACRPARATVVVVAVERPDFNANSAGFLAAAGRRRSGGAACRITNPGVAETDPARALARIDAVGADLVLTLPDALVSDDAFNRVARPIAATLRGAPAWREETRGASLFVVFRRLSSID